MIKGKGGDESADGGSVHDKKQRTENGALILIFYLRKQLKFYLLFSSDRGFSSETGEGGGPKRQLADQAYLEKRPLNGSNTLAFSSHTLILI